jgi:ribosome-associated protein
LRDRRITAEGVVVIKAQQHRTQEKNRQEALKRLQAMVKRAGSAPKKRIRTKPPRSAEKKRLTRKVNRGRLKALRKKVAATEN